MAMDRLGDYSPAGGIQYTAHPHRRKYTPQGGLGTAPYSPLPRPNVAGVFQEGN